MLRLIFIHSNVNDHFVRRFIWSGLKGMLGPMRGRRVDGLHVWVLCWPAVRWMSTQDYQRRNVQTMKTWRLPFFIDTIWMKRVTGRNLEKVTGGPNEMGVSGIQWIQLYGELKYIMGHLIDDLKLDFENSHFCKSAKLKKLYRWFFSIRFIWLWLSPSSYELLVQKFPQIKFMVPSIWLSAFIPKSSVIRV